MPDHSEHIISKTKSAEKISAFEQDQSKIEEIGKQCIEKGLAPERACRSQANDAANNLVDEVYNHVLKQFMTNGSAGSAQLLQRSQSSWHSYKKSVMDFHGEPSNSHDQEPLTAEFNLSKNRTKELFGLLKGGDTEKLEEEAKTCLNKTGNNQSCFEDAAAKQWVSLENAYAAFDAGYQNSEEIKSKFDQSKRRFDEFRKEEFVLINSLYPQNTPDTVKGVSLKADIMRHRHQQVYNSDAFFESSTKR